MTRPLVYIASPYTIGDVAENVARSMRTWNELWVNGFVPYDPLWSHFQQIYMPINWADWLEYDLHIIARCDALLRLDGESKGADCEVRFAKDRGIPVYYAIDDLLMDIGRLANE
jgi:hypothetical protein